VERSTVNIRIRLVEVIYFVLKGSNYNELNLAIAATLHLYYARFMTHFLNELGLIQVTEPFRKLIPIGVVMGEAYIVKETGQYLPQDECQKGMS